MPLRFEIKRKLAQKSGSVKSVDLHPTEPWILTSLYSGSVCIWDYQSQTMAKSFKVTKLPVRSAKFVARKQWVVAGADDMYIRVYNYNTMDTVKQCWAHSGYIRCVAVHPTRPYILSSSDDRLITLWDWEKSWKCTKVFEGHSKNVMQLTINPKDTNTFASASTDGRIKVWNLGSSDPSFTIRAHFLRANYRSFNCVDYVTCGDKSYLISGSDDHTAKVWDYQTNTCVQTLKGHTQCVTSVCFHPELEIIITGSLDGTVCIWHSTTYRLENTLKYGFGSVLAVGCMKGSPRIAIGYDEGTIMLKVGRETPVASMDNSGKITWAKLNEIQTVNIMSVGDDYEVSDGERLPLAVKELGTCDLYPHSLKHNPDGMFVSVCGNGEYIIYTALAWRKVSFGSALEIVWSSDGEYAVRESTTKIKIFNKYFQEKKSFRPTFSTERIYGGSLLLMCSNDFICFYDWAECRFIQRIDVNVKKVYWAKSGHMLAIASDSSFYVLRYNHDVVSARLDSGRSVDEEGIQDSFKLLYEVWERVRAGLWVGDCFIYISSSWKLNYCVGGETTTMFHLDRPMYFLGYLANQTRVYLIDKKFNVIGYTLPLALIEYMTLVVCGDVARASTVLPLIPKEHHYSFARFLKSRGITKEALEVATDPDRRFELAIHLGKLEIAKDMALVAKSQSKWKQLGELAMSTGVLDMAEYCLKRANDLSGTVQCYSALGDAEEIAKLIPLAKESGQNNVVFSCLFTLGKFDECLQMLVDSKRMPQAALMARAYFPSKVSEIVALWRKDLDKVNQKATDHEEYPNRYEDWQVALEVEARAAQTRGSYPAAEEDVNYGDRSHVSLVEVFKHMQLDHDDLGKDMENENNENNNNKLIDPAWKYSFLADKNDKNSVTCTFCKKVSKGGIFRQKNHLVGGNRNVRKCLKVPAEVQEEIKKHMEEKKRKRNYDMPFELQENMDFDDHEDDVEAILDKTKKNKGKQPDINKKKGPMDSLLRKPETVVKMRKAGKLRQTNIVDAYDKEKRAMTVQYIARFFYQAGIPFNAARLDSFKICVEAIGQYGPGLKPPSYHELRVPLLKKELEYTEEQMKKHKEEWKKHGCSVMSDAWTDGKGRSIINFLVNSPAGTMFMKSVDASSYMHTGEKIFELLNTFIDEIGVANVVQVVTDNGSNYVKAGKMLEKERPHLFWTPCAAHCIDLMLEDIGKIPQISKTLARGIEMTSYIYNHTRLLDLMRQFTGNIDLVRAGKTRFATCYLNLKRINVLKDKLRAMFISQEWSSSKWAKEAKGKRISEVILSPHFWNNVTYILIAMGPLVKALRLVDGEQKPSMGYIYEAMDRAKEAIAEGFKKKESKYMPLYKIIDNRWDSQLHHPLHAAGHFLNPEIYYDNTDMEFDDEIQSGFLKCVSRLVLDKADRINITKEVHFYKNAEKFFGIELAVETRKTKAPAEWWRLFGSSTPTLQQLAIKILSLTCSSCGCERNWSVFEQLHTKRRNRLESNRLNDLVFIKYNQKLKDRYDCRNIIDPICLDELDESNEWLTGGDVENENAENEFVLGEEDGLTWGTYANASGINEPRQHTRQSTASSSRSRTLLFDESDDEEDLIVAEDEVVEVESDEEGVNLEESD